MRITRLRSLCCSRLPLRWFKWIRETARCASCIAHAAESEAAVLQRDCSRREESSHPSEPAVPLKNLGPRALLQTREPPPKKGPILDWRCCVCKRQPPPQTRQRFSRTVVLARRRPRTRAGPSKEAGGRQAKAEPNIFWHIDVFSFMLSSIIY